MKDIKELAEYCLSCPTKPCQKACPLDNDITGFIKCIKNDNFQEAYHLLNETTVLSGVCGRICPHQKQCQGSCVRRFKGEPVQIGEMEAYVADLAFVNGWNFQIAEKKNGKSVAIIGGGPAGLTAAAFLTKNGTDVTIYEKQEKLGGIMRYGIPRYRLEENVLNNTIDKILELGINVEYNKHLGVNLTLEDLNQYDNIILSFGANISAKMNIQGEDLQGVLGGNKMLETGMFPDVKDKKVVVIGGGNVAMDASRSLKRAGASEVTILYRKEKEHMPAELKEIDEAEEDGVKIVYKTNLLKIEGNGIVEKVECINTKIVKNGDRINTENVENTNFILDVDYVIMAIGSVLDKQTIDALEMKIENDKIVNNNEKIYIAGDCAGTKSTIAWAAKSGRLAAEEIIKKS